MATIGSLFVSIGVGTKNLKKGLKKSEGMLDKFGKGLAPLTAGLVAGVGAVAAGVTAIGVAAVSASQDFQSGMRKIESMTGATGRELEAMGDIVKDVYTDNWGTSMDDVAQALGTVNQVLGQQGEQLGQTTTKALIFRDVLGVDINESLRAVRSAVETFGMTSDQVFDQMAATIQKVGDPAGDLADTVNEYSSVFAEAGFSAEEMFAILESGVGAGARNFDVIADAVKEFSIRIIDGSDTTTEAMDALFRSTGDVAWKFFEAQDKVAGFEAAIKSNEEALAQSEGAYKTQLGVLRDMERALSDAKRQLDELARPNLAGMEKYDDKLFELEQSANKLRLELIGIDPESSKYEEAQTALDGVNNEMERLALQKEIEFAPQFRALEQAAKDGTVEVVTFDQALQAITEQKGRIEGLEEAWRKQYVEVARAATEMVKLETAGEGLQQQLAQAQAEMAGLWNPTDEFFKALNNGSMTGRDAMSQVIQMLGQVDDKLLQNEIGVALFGTKWEDLGPQIIGALDPAAQKLEDVSGTVDKIGDAASSGPLAGFSEMWRELQILLEPVGAALLQLAEQAMPYLKEIMERLQPVINDFASTFGETIGPALMIIVDSLNRMGQALGITSEEMTGVDMVVATVATGLDVIITAVEATAVVFYLVATAVEVVVDWMRKLNNFVERGVSRWWDAAAALWDIVNAAGRLGSVGNLIGGVGNVTRSVLGFAEGGVVPGPTGAPRLAVVHGGETITPAGQSMGNTININGVTVSAGGGDLDAALTEAFGQLRRQIMAAAG